MLDSLTSDEACARASNPETPLEELVTLAEVCPCAALANPAWLVPESQEYLHSLSPLLLLRAVQAWEEVPAFWLPILVGIPYTPLRLVLAQKPLPSNILLQLVQDPDPEVRALAWEHPGAQEEPVHGLIRLLQAMEKESQEVLPKALAFTPRGPYLEILLARHPATPERVLREIARSKNPFALEGFCQREDLPPELVEALWPKLEGQPQWAEALLQRDLPPDLKARLYVLVPQRATQEALAALPEAALLPWLEGPVHLRLLLAQRPGLSHALLARLAENPETAVRAEVASRPDLPEDLRQKLLEDPASVVRDRARRKHEPS